MSKLIILLEKLEVQQMKSVPLFMILIQWALTLLLAYLTPSDRSLALGFFVVGMICCFVAILLSTKEGIYFGGSLSPKHVQITRIVGVAAFFMPFVLSILTPQKNFRHGSETQLIIFLIGAVAIICVIFVLFLILQWSQLFHAVRIQRMKGENFTVSSETLFFHILLSLTFVGGNLLVLKAALYR